MSLVSPTSSHIELMLSLSAILDPGNRRLWGRDPPWRRDTAELLSYCLLRRARLSLAAPALGASDCALRADDQSTGARRARTTGAREQLRADYMRWRRRGRHLGVGAGIAGSRPGRRRGRHLDLGGERRARDLGGEGDRGSGCGRGRQHHRSVWTPTLCA
jgi:hypothetical protein